MTSPLQSIVLSFTINLRRAVTLSMVVALVIVLTPSARSQTFQVIHTFSGGGDGANPHAGLTVDAAGNLYGTALNGGVGFGTVFKVRHSSASWVLTPLYSFANGDDGANPFGRVAIAQDGTLYGTTSDAVSGCNSHGCGTVFHLTPPPSAPRSALAPWNETVLFTFTGVYNGAIPQGDVIFDQSGNIYGTTIGGGNEGDGVVCELTPSAGGWTQTELYSPGDLSLFSAPYGGVVFDNAGNLYGTSRYGGYGGAGNVYRLSFSGSSWKAQSLHQFEERGNDGAQPIGGLIIDASGNLYGSTSIGGPGGGGTVFEITFANGSWTFSTLYNFPYVSDNGGPQDKLVMDAAGNLYGTAFADGAYGYGSVFKLSPGADGWSYTSLHDFTGGDDGANPYSNVVFDANGNVYGTTSAGGSSGDCSGGCGVVWEIKR